ncbi:hypothetical protein B0H14DRAFT_2623834 [Mycena olivaceomarginata]|nr:hypothetical protein B0H14DRAFT_2623834 [Mycena olivaceomarginata]
MQMVVEHKRVEKKIKIDDGTAHHGILGGPQIAGGTVPGRAGFAGVKKKYSYRDALLDREAETIFSGLEWVFTYREHTVSVFKKIYVKTWDLGGDSWKFWICLKWGSWTSCFGIRVTEHAPKAEGRRVLSQWLAWEAEKALSHAKLSANECDQSRPTVLLGFHCCDECCKPTFFFLPNDPSEEEISRAAKRKFYVVKRGTVGSEGVYTDWTNASRDIAKTKVHRVAGAAHESSKTADDARAIWARYCHRHHTHSPAMQSPARPPPYTPRAHATSPSTTRAGGHTRATPVVSRMASTAMRPMSSIPSTPVTPSTPRRFYRVSGSPRVLISRVDAEAELRSTGATSLSVGSTLADMEDDSALSPAGPTFYRVLGSARVGTSRDAAVAELVETGARGLLVGNMLAVVDVEDA